MKDPLSIEERNGSAPDALEEEEAGLIGPFTVLPYDHGFPKRYLARHFDDLDEALVFAAAQPGQGRHCSPAGRCYEDITWLVVDDVTGVRYKPGPEHREASA
jgi:hypothetical protein